MTKAKMLKIDESMDQKLTSVCDAALRYHGLQIMQTVVDVAEAIRGPSDKPVLETEEQF